MRVYAYVSPICVYLCFCVSVSSLIVHMHTHTRARARTHTHTHTHTQMGSIFIPLSEMVLIKLHPDQKNVPDMSYWLVLSPCLLFMGAGNFLFLCTYRYTYTHVYRFHLLPRAVALSVCVQMYMQVCGASCICKYMGLGFRV
jgi:hypothetical protein